MNRNIASILWTLARTSTTTVAEAQKNRMDAAKTLEAEGIITLTDRGDGTYTIRLMRDSY